MLIWIYCICDHCCVKPVFILETLDWIWETRPGKHCDSGQSFQMLFIVTYCGCEVTGTTGTWVSLLWSGFWACKHHILISALIVTLTIVFFNVLFQMASILHFFQRFFLLIVTELLIPLDLYHCFFPSYLSFLCHALSFHLVILPLHSISLSACPMLLGMNWFWSKIRLD